MCDFSIPIRIFLALFVSLVGFLMSLIITNYAVFEGFIIASVGFQFVDYFVARARGLYKK